MDNPEFAELLDRMTADVNAAVEEIFEWKRIEEVTNALRKG